MSDEKKICVKVYFNSKSFAEVATLAEKAGKRRGGLVLFTQKKNGMGDEKIANTDGISKFLKFCADQWVASEAERTRKLAEIMAREKEIVAEKARLGIQ